MILFNLRCANGHDFEAWFRDGAAYENRVAGELTCPVCGDTAVAKAPMAPRIGRGLREPGPVEAGVAAEAARQVRELSRKIANTCDYVGEGFAEEARRIHYGEVAPRDIYGEATPAQAEELRDEGVEFHRIPWLPPTSS